MTTPVRPEIPSSPAPEDRVLAGAPELLGDGQPSSPDGDAHRPLARRERRGSRLRFRAYRELPGSLQVETAPDVGARRGRPRTRSTLELIGAFWGLLKGLRLPIALSLLATTAASLLRLAPPAATGLALDQVLGERRASVVVAGFHLPAAPLALLATVALGLIVLALAAAAVATWGRYLNALTLRRFQSRLRRRVFAHCLRMPLHRIRSYQSGGLAGLLREDVAGAVNLMSTMVYTPWRATVQLGGTLGALAVIDWRALAVALPVLAGMYTVHRRWIRGIRPLWREVRLLRRLSDAYATEAFAGVRVIRSFGRHRTEAGRYARDQHVLLRHEMLAWWTGVVVEVVWSLVIPLAVATLIWYGGSRVLGDTERLASGLLRPGDAFTTGTLVTLLFYLTMLLEPLPVLANAATGVQNGLAALDRTLDVLEEGPELTGASGAIQLRPSEVVGRVTLRRVTFRYPGQRQSALEDLTLEVPGGQMVALVGPSGAGKSTLCDLIARFHDPSDGVIGLDGIDIREIELGCYRRLIGLVDQDVFLFEGTIAENIAYGKRDATLAEIRRAAEAALAADFIEQLEDGYDSRIGERGVGLSGGQRKRLAVARALLIEPRILILDEATSELDADTERLLYQRVTSMMRGRTVFVSAHRLSTVVHADVIVVLEAGRVVDQGSHGDLLVRCQTYRRLVEAQVLDTERFERSASADLG